MKKCLFLFATLLALTLIVLFSLVIPKTYHHFIHNKWPKEHIISQSIDLNQTTSTLTFRNKVQIKSYTFFNPLKNYIDIKVFEREKENRMLFNFQISAHIESLTKLSLKAHLSDKDVLNIDHNYSIRGLRSTLASFSIFEIPTFLNKKWHEILPSKSILITGESIKFEQEETKIELEDFNIQLTLNNGQRGIDLEGVSKIKNLISPVNYKDLSLRLRLSSFEPKMLADFITNELPTLIFQGHKKINLFRFLPYIKGLKYPYKTDFNIEAQNLKNHLSFVAKSNKFLSLKNYTLNYDFQGQRQEALFLIKQLILWKYPKAVAKSYQLSPDQEPSQRFLERSKVEKIIKLTLKEELEKDSEALLNEALKLEFFNSNPLKTNLKLENGRLELLKKSLSSKNFSKMTVLLFDNYLKEMGQMAPKLLESKGLYPVL